MSAERGKAIVPLLGVLAALAMGVAAFATVLHMQERERRMQKEREVQLLSQERDDLRAQFEAVQQAKVKLEGEANELRQDLALSRQELAKAVEQQEALAKSLEGNKGELTELRRSLETAQEDRKKFQEELAKLQDDYGKVQDELAEAQRENETLTAKLEDASGVPSVQLDKVMVSQGPQTSAPAQAVNTMTTGASATAIQAVQAPPNGQVLVINREYDFVVVDLGKNQGLNIGQEFSVVRDSQVVGRVKVEKVYDDLSAAAVLPGTQVENLREGDQVRAL